MRVTLRSVAVSKAARWGSTPYTRATQELSHERSRLLDSRIESNRRDHPVPAHVTMVFNGQASLASNQMVPVRIRVVTPFQDGVTATPQTLNLVFEVRILVLERKRS